MAKNQDNMFGSFGSSLNERVHEQAHTEAVVTGQKPHPGTVGRPRKRVNAVTMSISISEADKLLVKRYAFDHALTVSDLIHTWINQHCVEG